MPFVSQKTLVLAMWPGGEINAYITVQAGYVYSDDDGASVSIGTRKGGTSTSLLLSTDGARALADAILASLARYDAHVMETAAEAVAQ